MKPVWCFIAGLLATVFIDCSTGEEGAFEDDQDIEEEQLSAEQLKRLHKQFDQDGNGKVSLSEIMHHAQVTTHQIAKKDIQAILEEIDTNKDGVIDLDEHLNDVAKQAEGGDEDEMKELQARKTLETQKFVAADRNSNRVLDADEVIALFYPETNEKVLGITVAENMQQKDKNGDGKLTAQEFWQATGEHSDDGELSDEEKADFEKLDLNHNGFLEEDELQHWESGQYHTAEAMKQLFNIADKDNDMHITADEMANAREQISGSDAHYHLIEWAEHYEL